MCVEEARFRARLDGKTATDITDGTNYCGRLPFYCRSGVAWVQHLWQFDDWGGR
jgi:hypothetical protein